MRVIWTNLDGASHYPRTIISDDDGVYHEFVFDHHGEVIYHVRTRKLSLCTEFLCPPMQAGETEFSCGGPVPTTSFEDAIDQRDLEEPGMDDSDKANRMMDIAASDPEAWMARMVL